jgi:flagellar motor protein MotB
MADEFDGLYAPIVGSSETETRHIPEETPPALLSRTNNLRREYDDLRGELVQELNVVEQRMSQPAEQAKSYLAPMKKAIKKRNDKKVRKRSIELRMRKDHILITIVNSRIMSAFKAKSMASSINQSAPIAKTSISPRQN